MNIDQKNQAGSKAFVIGDTVEYLDNTVVIRSILKKNTGHVSVIAIDSGETLTSKISPFDTLLQIIDGNAEIIINDSSNLMHAGQSILIPANSRNTIKANVRFKMISTVIRSGFEEILV